MHVKTGVECEFFLISPDGKPISDDADTPGEALLRPAGADAPLRRHRRDLRLHAGARLEALPERPRGRQRPVRDELGIRRRADHRRPARLLQVHGQVDRREARPARDLHAEALPEPDRQRLPRARLAVGQDRQDQSVPTMPRASSACRQAGYNFLGGIMHACRGAVPRSPTRRSTPTSASTRRARMSGATWSPNTVTWTGNNRTHMVRMPGRRPLRAAPARRRRQSLSAAGRRSSPPASTASRNKRDPGKRLDIDMYTDGHTVKGAQEAAAQPARCAARVRQATSRCKAALGEEFSSAPTSS